MKLLAVICVVLASSQALNLSEIVGQEWNNFKVKHDKVYSDPEEEQRSVQIYIESREKVIKHNEAYKKGEVTFKIRLNKFSDMTDEEFSSSMSGFIPSKDLKSSNVQYYQRKGNLDLPTSIDWRNLGAVTPVMNQGSCASCWAISAAGAIAGQHFKKTGRLVAMSEQNLIDCSGRSYGNYGCDGGDMRGALQFVIDNHGIDTEQYCPYKGRKMSCRFSKNYIGTTISSYVAIPDGDVQALKEAVATLGPISVGIDSKPSSFKSYDSGIYYDAKCKTQFNDLDHGVLVVGYGTENGNDYWIVKNSWGADWGESGYVRISTKNNNCGVASYASYPVL